MRFRMRLQWSLKLRLILGFACITLLFLAVTVYTIRQMDGIKASGKQQELKAELQIQALDLKGTAQEVKDIASGLMISRSPTFIAKYQDIRPVFQDKITKLADTAVTDEQIKWRSQLIMASTDYLNMFDQAVNVITDSSLKEIEIKKNTEYLYQQTQEQRDKIFTLVNHFYDAFSKDAHDASAASAQLMDKTRLTLYLLSLAVLLLAVGLTVYIAVAFHRSMRKLQSAVAVMAEGNLSHMIETDSADELGMLSRDFNRMVERVRGMIGTLQELGASLSGHSSQFLHFSKDTAAANANIVQAIGEISAGADQQAGQAEKSSGIMEELDKEIGYIWHAAQSMQETSLASAITTRTGQESLSSLEKASGETENAIMMVQEVMSSLSARSGQINTIAATILDIAARTNILALNAAIESARAGAGGRGFAVIAEEVRILSQQTGESSRHVAVITDGLSKEMARLDDYLTATRQSLQNQNQRMADSLQAFNAIHAAMENVAESIAVVHGNVDAVRRKNSTLTESLQQVAAVAQETAAGVVHVESAATAQDSAIRQIALQAVDMNRLSEDLFRQLNQFIIEKNGQQSDERSDLVCLDDTGCQETAVWPWRLLIRRKRQVLKEKRA